MDMGVARGDALAQFIGGPGACFPRKFLKNGCSEMRFHAIFALLMAESLCRVFQ